MSGPSTPASVSGGESPVLERFLQPESAITPAVLSGIVATGSMKLSSMFNLSDNGFVLLALSCIFAGVTIIKTSGWLAKALFWGLNALIIMITASGNTALIGQLGRSAQFSSLGIVMSSAHATPLTSDVCKKSDFAVFKPIFGLGKVAPASERWSVIAFSGATEAAARQRAQEIRNRVGDRYDVGHEKSFRDESWWVTLGHGMPLEQARCIRDMAVKDGIAADAYMLEKPANLPR